MNVIGFDGLRQDSAGSLSFGDGALVLAVGKATGTIPLNAIRSFTIERSTTALMRGTEGKIVGFIPRGVGNLYHAIRRGAHTLTIHYVSEDEALHAAVLILPKKRKDDVLARFAEAGLFPSPMPASLEPASRSHSFRAVAAADTAISTLKPSVSIMLPDAHGQALPPAYTAAIYEHLNAELSKSGLFDTVWRHGNTRAQADAMTLSVRIKAFKKGNPAVRGCIPVFEMFVGKTQITADLTLAGASGNILLQREVKGSKQMSGESIAATKSLAQRVRKSIGKVPGFTPGKPGTKIAAR